MCCFLAFNFWKIRWEILTFSNLVSEPYFYVIQRKLFFVLFGILVLFAWLWLLPIQTKQLILVLPMQSSVDIGVTDAILGWYWCYRCNPRLIWVLPMQSSVDTGVTDQSLESLWFPSSLYLGGTGVATSIILLVIVLPHRSTPPEVFL